MVKYRTNLVQVTSNQVQRKTLRTRQGKTIYENK